MTHSMISRTLNNWKKEKCGGFRIWPWQPRYYCTDVRLVRTFHKIWTVRGQSSWPVVALLVGIKCKSDRELSYNERLFLLMVYLEEIAIWPLSIPCKHRQTPSEKKEKNDIAFQNRWKVQDVPTSSVWSKKSRTWKCFSKRDLKGFKCMTVSLDFLETFQDFQTSKTSWIFIL